MLECLRCDRPGGWIQKSEIGDCAFILASIWGIQKHHVYCIYIYIYIYICIYTYIFINNYIYIYISLSLSLILKFVSSCLLQNYCLLVGARKKSDQALVPCQWHKKCHGGIVRLQGIQATVHPVAKPWSLMSTLPVCSEARIL